MSNTYMNNNYYEDHALDLILNYFMLADRYILGRGLHIYMPADLNMLYNK
jgi:hypothetical protein